MRTVHHDSFRLGHDEILDLVQSLGMFQICMSSHMNLGAGLIVVVRGAMYHYFAEEKFVIIGCEYSISTYLQCYSQTNNPPT